MELLDNKELIRRFKDFFEDYKKKEIRKILRENLLSLEISFTEIAEFDIELSEQLLAYPNDILRIMEETLKEFYDISQIPSNKPIKVRLTSLPVTETYMIRQVRAEHIGKLIMVEGIIRRKTDVRPRLKYLDYMCINPDCPYSKEKLRIPQSEEKAKVLKACPRCRSPVEVVNKELIDSQNLILEEMTEQLENSADQPKRINVLLQEDLVSPFKDSKTNPGSKVYVIGIIKELPLQTRTGADSINYDIILEGIYLGLNEEEYSEVSWTKEEEEEIKKLANSDDVIDQLVESMAPSIHGNNRIKEAIMLQLFGGTGGVKGDGVKTRGNIHMLLLGDPGAAKSQLLKAATRIAPKSMFVSGKSASAAGLTATVMKDELTKGWALEAGAMVLASGGLCAIDELDKMSDEDTSAMHEALEQQTISIAKANIRATLRCETTVLGAANPKYGRFDPYGDIAKQINFPPALISRFDLIFILRDIPDKKRDDMIANHILQSHRDKTKSIAKLSPDFIKKYLAYTKRNIQPILTEAAIKKIKDFYVAIRNAAGEEDEGAQKSVPVTARQLEAIVRLAEAYAKIKLDNQVKEEYAEKAIEMLMYCLKRIGIDPKTGELDIDRITTGITASTRNQYKVIQQIIEKLERELPEVKLNNIIEEAEKLRISKSEVEKTLEKLKQEGVIFEPRRNVYKKLE